MADPFRRTKIFEGVRDDYGVAQIFTPLHAVTRQLIATSYDLVSLEAPLGFDIIAARI